MNFLVIWFLLFKNNFWPWRYAQHDIFIDFFGNYGTLRFYITFKVRKFESLFYKINTCLQKATTCIGLRAEQIFSFNISYTYFSILGVTFTVPFLCYFQKLQLLVGKKFWTNFCCIVLLYLWTQKACLRFLKSYFRLEILIFLSFVVSFLVEMLSKKPLFWRKKHQRWNLRFTFVEKLLKINVAKY